MLIVNQFLLKSNSPFLQPSIKSPSAEEEDFQINPNSKVYVKKNWTTKEMVRDPLFYLVLPNFFMSPFLLTGFFFYQVELAKYKSWGMEIVASGFIVFGIVRIFVGLLSGYFIDKFFC